MAKATGDRAVLAQSDNTIVVEDNHYLPLDSLQYGFFPASNVRTSYPWNGVAHYYDIEVNGQTNNSAHKTYLFEKRFTSTHTIG